MMDLHRLHLLRELSARGTIAATAEALSYSPPAISQQLAKLEVEAGVKLLERVGRGVRLTDAGRILVAHAEELLAGVERAEADLRAATNHVGGTLHVTTFQSAAVTLLAPALADLTNRHPALHVHVSEVEPDVALEALTLGAVDLVLADEYPHRPWPRLRTTTYQHLCSDPLRVALPADHHLAASGNPITLSDLADDPWAVGLAGSAYAHAVIAACNEIGGFQPTVRHHATDLLIILSLVRARQAVAIVPDLLGAQHDSRIAVRPIANGTLARRIFTAIRKSSIQRPGVRELRAALRQECAAGRSVIDAPAAAGTPRPAVANARDRGSYILSVG